MYRFSNRRGAQWLAAALWLLPGCGKEAEWEERPGSIVLHAAPLPPQPGMPLTLSVEATNSGPVSVYQGDAIIAAFANTTLDGRKSYVVTAVSDDTPRAESVGYDFQRLVVEATPFVGSPGPSGNAAGSGSSGSSGGGGNGGGTGPVEDCPGIMETPGACSMPSGASVQLEVMNRLDEPVTLYRRDPMINSCFNQVVALIGAGSSRSVQQVSGNVMLVVRDSTNEALRSVTLPEVASCRLVISLP